MESLVSIITPTYNSEAFIAQTIESVQNQIYQNWEMIIVDDGSSDGTVELIQRFIESDSRIQLHKLAVNLGAGVARNHALNNAKGKYISFLDADDLWKPQKLEKQVQFLLHNQLNFTFSFYECINHEGKSLNRRVEAPEKLSYCQLFFCNFVGNLTGIYDAEYFGKLTISTIRKRQDWILWLTILKKIKKAQVVPESLAFYRMHQNSISSSKIDLIKYNYTVYRKFHQYNVFSSAICMMGFLFTQLIIKPFFVKKIK